MDTTTLREGLQLFETEVEYRLAKWILAGMLQDGIISDSEMHEAWVKIVERYNPPFLELEDYDRKIGDGVIVNDR